MRHDPRHVRRHRVVEQPRVARDFHGHFVRRPQLLDEPRQQHDASIVPVRSDRCDDKRRYL